MEWFLEDRSSMLRWSTSSLEAAAPTPFFGGEGGVPRHTGLNAAALTGARRL